MSLVTAATFERAADQLDFVSLDLLVEVDPISLEELFRASRPAGIEFRLQGFDLRHQCCGE